MLSRRERPDALAAAADLPADPVSAALQDVPRPVQGHRRVRAQAVVRAVGEEPAAVQVVHRRARKARPGRRRGRALAAVRGHPRLDDDRRAPEPDGVLRPAARRSTDWRRRRSRTTTASSTSSSGDEAIGLFIAGLQRARPRGEGAGRGSGVAVGRRASPTRRRTARSPSGPGSTPGSRTSAASGSSDEISDFTASGDVVNSTARLASLAGAGELLVSTESAREAALPMRRARTPRRRRPRSRGRDGLWSSSGRRGLRGPGQNALRRMIRPRKTSTTISTSVAGGIVDTVCTAPLIALLTSAPRSACRRRRRARRSRPSPDRRPVRTRPCAHLRTRAQGPCDVGCAQSARWPRRRSSPGRRPPTRWPPVARRSSATTGARRTTC